jgi:hypothetical protein
MVDRVAGQEGDGDEIIPADTLVLSCSPTAVGQFGTESLQELRALLTSTGSAVTNAFTADQEKP